MEDHKLSLRADQIERYIASKRMKLSGSYEPNQYPSCEVVAEVITNLSQYNIIREIDINTIVHELSKLFAETNGEIFIAPNKFLDIMISIRKITCRNLTSVNDGLLNNNIHLLIFSILEKYQNFEKISKTESSILVSIQFIK